MPHGHYRLNEMHRYVRMLTYLVCVVTTLLINACSSDKQGPQISGLTMGTTYSVQWTDSNAIDRESLDQEISTRLEMINDLMSTYLANSQLSEFNQSQDTGWHAVDIELAQLVAMALTICKQSNNAFDITVGPLVNLWGFGAEDANFRFPTDTEIEITLRAIGCELIEVRLDPPAINKKSADVYVDLSAIAKGYAVDELAKILHQHGIQNYMVEIGGEVKAKGIAPHGNTWRIGIETPDALRGNILDIISLADIAVATSGDYRNFFEHEGQRYSHTIDPATGYPVKHEVASVTVLNDSAALADAWATAFMVLGANKSLQIAEQQNLSGLLVTRHNDKYKKTTFGAMQDYLTQ